MKKVGIIIVNYKNYAKRFLAECRDSLREQTYPGELIRVYIVDNASSGESRRFIASHFPEVIIIPREDGNYAAANNAGMKRAAEDGCELFVIANMDVKFDKEWLGELVSAVLLEPMAAIAQSKILLYSKKAGDLPKINTLGNISHFLGFGFTSAYYEADRPIEGNPEIKGYASGCSFIIKKMALDKIGGYNEEFFMYHDDMEIGLRAKLAGFKIILVPKSVVYHKYEFSRSVRQLYFMERNRYLVIFMFYKLPTIFLVLPALIAMDLGMLFYSIINGWSGTKISVYKYFFRPASWKKIFSARAKVRAIRKVPDAELLKNFQGRVLFQEIENPILKYIANPIFNLYWKIAKRLIAW
ncbi:MAG: glycosyltransferase family 2 protein [Patescibacteria group bacterium]|jgi:hypothetical protein